MKILAPLHYDQTRRICMDYQGKKLFFKVSEILYCESNDGIITFFLVNGSHCSCCKTMKDLAAEFENDGLLRSHQSFLVNIMLAEVVQKKRDLYLIVNHIEFKVARRRVAYILSKLMN
jgi:DNA-binding LytR/AlgR family response regulator